MGDADLSVLLLAWLTGRSIARGLSAPVPDGGGFRVDTNGNDEIRRWVFPRIGQGLVDRVAIIDAPGFVLKVCATDDELRAVLPNHWQLQPAAWFMTTAGSIPAPPLAEGYTIDVERDGAVTRAKVRDSTGALVASGFGGQTPDAFVYDRIETAAAHRRRGLGRAVMAALDRTRQEHSAPGLLVATKDGRALYSTMGWRTIAPYATASIVAT